MRITDKAFGEMNAAQSQRVKNVHKVALIGLGALVVVEAVAVAAVAHNRGVRKGKKRAYKEIEGPSSRFGFLRRGEDDCCCCDDDLDVVEG